jgi:hypothetical protein
VADAPSYNFPAARRRQLVRIPSLEAISGPARAEHSETLCWRRVSMEIHIFTAAPGPSTPQHQDIPVTVSDPRHHDKTEMAGPGTAPLAPGER